MTTAPTDAPLRRPYLPDPGESLLLVRAEPDTDTDPGAPGLIRLGERVERFTTDTGLTDLDVYADPLLAIPVPIYATRIQPGRRRWDGLNPLMMWHPLMWLPQRVADPYLLTGAGTGEDDRLESTDEWALRVAIELTASGLYDPATGGWVDVLALHDLDITDPAVQGRLHRWLAGADDPDLDRIDLTSYLDMPDDPAWAVVAVQGLLADLYGASWALTAADLGAIVTGTEQLDDARAQTTLDQVVTLAGNYLRDAVLDVDITVGDRLAGLDDTDVTARRQQLQEVLTLVASAYEPSLLELENLAAA